MRIIYSGYTDKCKPKMKVVENRDCYFLTYKIPCKVVWYCWVEEVEQEEKLFFHDSEVLYRHKIRSRMVFLWLPIALCLVWFLNFQGVNTISSLTLSVGVLFLMQLIGWQLSKQVKDNDYAYSVPWKAITDIRMDSLRSTVCDDKRIKYVSNGVGEQHVIQLVVNNFKYKLCNLTVSNGSLYAHNDFFEKFKKAFSCSDPEVVNVPILNELEYEKMMKWYDERLIYRSNADGLLKGDAYYSRKGLNFFNRPFFRSMPYIAAMVSLSFLSVNLEGNVKDTKKVSVVSLSESPMDNYKRKSIVEAEKEAEKHDLLIRNKANELGIRETQEKIDINSKKLVAKKTFKASYDKWLKYYLYFLDHQDDIRIKRLLEAEENLMIEKADVFRSGVGHSSIDLSVLMKQEIYILDGVAQDKFWKWFKENLFLVAGISGGQGVELSFHHVKYFLRNYSKMKEMYSQALFLKKYLVDFAVSAEWRRRRNYFLTKDLKRKKRIYSKSVSRIMDANIAIYNNNASREKIGWRYKNYIDNLVDRIRREKSPISMLGRKYGEAVKEYRWNRARYVAEQLLNGFFLMDNEYYPGKTPAKEITYEEFFPAKKEHKVYLPLKRGWCKNSFYTKNVVVYLYVKGKRTRHINRNGGYSFLSRFYVKEKNKTYNLQIRNNFAHRRSKEWFSCRVSNRRRLIVSPLTQEQMDLLDKVWKSRNRHRFLIKHGF